MFKNLKIEKRDLEGDVNLVADMMLNDHSFF